MKFDATTPSRILNYKIRNYLEKNERFNEYLFQVSVLQEVDSNATEAISSLSQCFIILLQYVFADFRYHRVNATCNVFNYQNSPD